MFSQKTAGGTETLLRRCNTRRTTETLPSLPPVKITAAAQKCRLLLTSSQTKKGKGAPELIQRISGKWQQEGEIVKQVNNCEYYCLLDSFPEQGTSLSSVGHPNKSDVEALLKPSSQRKLEVQ